MKAFYVLSMCLFMHSLLKVTQLNSIEIFRHLTQKAKAQIPFVRQFEE